MIVTELRRRIPGTFAIAAVAAALLMAASVGPSFQVASSHLDDEGDDPDEMVDLDDPEFEDLTDGLGTEEGEETESTEEGEETDGTEEGEETESTEEDPQALETEDPEDDERSETATRVHTALSGDPDIGPGHEEFGQRVSERARTMHLGGIVSRAARGVEEETEDDEVEQTEEVESSNGNRGPGNNNGRGGGRGPR